MPPDTKGSETEVEEEKDSNINQSWLNISANIVKMYNHDHIARYLPVIKRLTQLLVFDL